MLDTNKTLWFVLASIVVMLAPLLSLYCIIRIRVWKRKDIFSDGLNLLLFIAIGSCAAIILYQLYSYYLITVIFSTLFLIVLSKSSHDYNRYRVYENRIMNFKAFKNASCTSTEYADYLKKHDCSTKYSRGDFFTYAWDRLPNPYTQFLHTGKITKIESFINSLDNGFRDTIIKIGIWVGVIICVLGVSFSADAIIDSTRGSFTSDTRYVNTITNTIHAPDCFVPYILQDNTVKKYDDFWKEPDSVIEADYEYCRFCEGRLFD